MLSFSGAIALHAAPVPRGPPARRESSKSRHILIGPHGGIRIDAAYQQYFSQHTTANIPLYDWRTRSQGSGRGSDRGHPGDPLPPAAEAAHDERTQGNGASCKSGRLRNQRRNFRGAERGIKNLHVL